MSFEVGDSRETLAYFLFVSKLRSFQPAHAASLCSAVGDCCAIIRACVTIVLENEFSHIVPQSRQSLIAPTLFALLKPSAVVSSLFYGCFAVIVYRGGEITLHDFICIFTKLYLIL